MLVVIVGLTCPIFAPHKLFVQFYKYVCQNLVVDYCTFYQWLIHACECYKPKTSITQQLMLRAQTCNLRELEGLGLTSFHSKLKTFKNLTNCQALNSSSKCKVTMLKVMCQRNDSKQSQRMLESHGLGPSQIELKLSTILSGLHEEAQGFE